MEWFDENPDLIFSGETTKNFTGRLKHFDSVSELPRINLLCEDKLIAIKLINTLAWFENGLTGLNLRFGWLNEDSHEITDVFDDETIFVGKSAYCNSFEKIFGSNTCKISRKARDKNIHIAYQRHFGYHGNPRSLSLGDIRKRMNYVDPLLRNVDGIFFFLDAIRKQDSNVENAFVSGMNIDEACIVARYAGMSQSNKLIYFNIGEGSITDESSQVTALLIWYYLEGSGNKNIEAIEHKNNHTYMVNNPYFENPVKFIKTNITGRWWYQHPEDNFFIPCTEDDYIAISEGRIPDNFVLTSVH
ncbi:MAG: hypothetical protein HKN67_04695 [Saprospiraceae bacterium]|nr:hypothetical protein [Bacteroidia bacterium]MBT8229268.1 hypothetical protein [Bacteroidia bacterium]NNF21217.1 hypothetical protein [Saprospiraceae bacterium]NNK89049.1 hypothetical protein [Saprospiraceae bacterium]